MVRDRLADCVRDDLPYNSPVHTLPRYLMDENQVDFSKLRVTFRRNIRTWSCFARERCRCPRVEIIGDRREVEGGQP